MKTYSLNELVDIACKHSPYYKNLYKNVGTFTDLSQLPILDSTAFWKANTIKDNQVLTGPQTSGIVFKSGGTTGSPKFSFFSLEEWELFTHAFGEGMRKGGLKPGEKIANMFYAGDLYASFMFISKSIEKSNSDVVHFPLSGGADFNHIIETMNSFEISTWAGVPTSMMKLSEYAQTNKLHAPTKILFGGESMYEDQISFVKEVFPKVQIQSIGYASVDGGLLGYLDESCDIQEHRVFTDYTVMEILDEDTLDVISEPNRPGKMFLTNLTRTLMPIIRYPVGDKAMWIDSSSVTHQRKFRILGRSDEGARVGPATVYYDDMNTLLNTFHDVIHIKGFQLRLVHFENMDQLVIRVAAANPSVSVQNQIKEHIYQEREMIKKLVNEKLIHPVAIEFVNMTDLDTNGRTGKLKRIIDARK
jgi:phenylacetate-CoA ligase